MTFMMVPFVKHLILFSISIETQSITFNESCEINDRTMNNVNEYD